MSSDPDLAASVVAVKFVEGYLDIESVSNAKIASNKKTRVSKQYFKP